MDARYYNGDVDEREFSDRPTCDQCGCELYPEEAADERCRRCRENAYEAGEDGEDFRGDEAEGYAFEQHEAERSLK